MARTGTRHGTDLPPPTSPVQFEAWRHRLVPPVEEVRSGVWSIPLPLPEGNPMGYVTSYAVIHPAGVVVVDPGWDHDPGWAALVEGLAMAARAVEDVTHVLVTHFHPDHYGLAPRVREASGATIRMHADDAGVITGADFDVERSLTRIADFLRACGAPESEIDGLASERRLIRRLHRTPAPDAPLGPGERIELGERTIEAVWTPGHTPGHTCLYLPEDRLLLTGDHVLPRVSPNVSAYDHSSGNPLGDFLSSLAVVALLDVAEVLPAHEYRFGELDSRLAALRTHHDARLADLHGLVRARGPLTSWELATTMTWSRDWSDMEPYTRRSANGEVLAHLVELERRGLVAPTGTDVCLWEAVQP